MGKWQKRLNDGRLYARAPFQISTDIFLVAKAVSYFFSLGHLNWTWWYFILKISNCKLTWKQKFTVICKSRTLEFTNICSTLFKTLSLIWRSWPSHRLIITEDCKCIVCTPPFCWGRELTLLLNFQKCGELHRTLYVRHFYRGACGKEGVPFSREGGAIFT